MHWIKDTVFYNIYPLGFCGAPKENDFVQSYRLDKIYDFIPHLKRMGVNAIVFNPLFESTRHGYDTIDYKKVDSRLGDNDSFKKICDTLHQNGIRVLLDGVFNHVGRDFFAFKDIQERGMGSIYCSWFHNIRFDQQSPYGDPFSYEGWAGYYDLVKLNLQNNDVVEYLLDAVRYWIDEFDIDGLRLDAANCIDLNFFRRLKAVCTEKKSDFWMYGEIVGGDYNRWVGNDTMDSVTNYEIYKALYSCHNDRNYFEFAHSLDREYGNWGIYKSLYLYNFADNHDVTRVASSIRDKNLLKNIYTMLYTMPGAPSVYYGSEFAMEGKKQKSSDDDLRQELNLNDLQNPDQALFEHICMLGALKHKLPALQYGSYKNEVIQLEHLCYSMTVPEQTVFVLLNQSTEARNISFDTGSQGVLTDVLHDNKQYPCGGWQEIAVAPQSSMILVKNDGSLRITFDHSENEAGTAIAPAQPTSKISDEELQPLPIVKGRYRHFKGNEYEVIDFANDSETGARMVIYRALYGERELWVRPYDMFAEVIERDGRKMYRFEKIN